MKRKKVVLFLAILVFMASVCYGTAQDASTEVEKQNARNLFQSEMSYVSGACYSLVIGEYEIFTRIDNGPLNQISKLLMFKFWIQGRKLLIEVDLTPGHLRWNELKDMHFGNQVWLEVGEDGKVLDIRKNAPGEEQEKENSQK
jgi:hypothetical protein